MATTTRTGAIYGIGVYGVALYGVSNVSILVDGVQGTCTTDSGLVIEADANHVVIGVTSAGAVGQVGTIGTAVVVPTGVEGTGNIGTTSHVGDALIIPTGVEGTGAIGTVTVLAAAVTVLNVSVEGTLQVGTVNARANADVVPTGNEVTGSIGSVTVFENELQIPIGVAATLVLGTPVVVNTSFDYEAVKDQYDKRRTVYVKPRATSDTRIIYVPAINRVVYIIGTRSTPFTRTKLAA
jgi:hypothetical protein